MKHTIARILMAGGVAGGTLVAGNAAAIDWNVTGFVRQEIAVSLGGENPNNTWGNPWNGRINQNITSPAYGDGSNALAATNTYVDAGGHVGGYFQEGFGFSGAGGWTLPGGANPYPGLAPAPTGEIAPSGEWVGLAAGANTSNPVDCHHSLVRAVDAGLPGYGPRTLAGSQPGSTFPMAFAEAIAPGTICDPASIASLNPADDTNFNLFSTRMEIDIQAKINDQFSAYMKFRAYADATSNFSDVDMGDNYGQADYYGNRRATRLEYNWNDVIIDIPHFYLDWNKGPLWIRVGNQVIAWGEAYFFRTMDVANGLDLRRHLTLGPGAEEYQDQRIASPGIRVSYTFNNGWELDAFAQMFQPTVLPGQNTPYNVIGMSGARFDDSMGQEDAENSINYGFKLNMPLTEAFTGMIAWVNRRNPDGVYHNADAPTFWAGLPNTGCLNANSDTLNLVGLVNGATTVAGANSALVNGGLSSSGGYAPMPSLDTRARPMANGCGSFFAPDPRGTPSQQYWPAIQAARLDNRDYLPAVIDEGPASEWAVRDMFGFGQERTFADTYRTVEGFRAAFGPYIQWVGRQFKRENVFMVGGNYLVTSDNEWLDQLIIRGEVSYTPDKRITNDLSYRFTEVDDVVSSLIFEKYQRLSANFPATYMVAQWMHRTSTDLFGRDLDNNDTPGISNFIDPDTGAFLPAAFDPDAMKPRGTDNANYVVFAFQQPFPNLIWRFDFAILVDVAGGYLLQPGVRYRPSAKWQWDFYSTIIESPGGQNDTITETLDWADEFFVRLTYFF